MGSPIRILHLDDNSSDATLVALALEVEQKKLHTQVHYVQTKEEYLAALDQKDFDLILSDYRMPGFDGDQALAVAREKCPEIPFIMVTGELGEELVIQTLHRGATDYVLKDRMFRLVPAIKRALAEADNYRKRKEAEREIQKRQGELWVIIQAMHGGVMVFDAEGGVVLVNDALVSTLGYKDSSELRRTLVHLAGILELWEYEGRLIPLDEWPVSRIMRGEIVTNMELKARRIDTGREWFFSFSGQPVRDETGKQILSVLVVRDITERRIAEEAQRQSEERFRALVQASANVVYRMSPDWKEMRQLVGQNFIADTKDPSRTWLEKYIHPDDQPRVLAAIEKAIRSKSVFELEHRVLRVDGSLGWTFSRAIPMLAANGEITEWFGMASDITEQKTSEQSLKAERARLTAILESIPEEVWYADNDRRVMQVNRKVVEDFGEQLEVGGEIEKIAAQFEVYRANGTPRPPDEAPPLRALHGEFIREEEEIVRAPATGELRYRLVTASPVRDSQGDVTGSVSIVRDITERKRAEEAVREAALFPEENPSPALRISHEGTLLYANPASRDILQERGFRVKEKVPYALYEPVNEALEKKQGRTFDLSVKDATYSFLVVPIVERQYANLYGRDVTDQRHAEERLKRLNEELQKRNLELDGERLKWQKLIEGIADEVWACDLEGRVSLLSLKSPTSGGPAQVSDEVLRTLLSEFEVLRPDGSLRPDEESPLQLSLKGQIVRGEESVRLRSTGETRIRQHSCVPVRDTDGNIVGAVAIVRDITEGRQAEEKVRRLNEELEERVQQRTVALERANKELEAFSYTVSHDLKAPLRAITGFTGLLVNSSKEGVSAMAPDKQRQYMELILSSAEQMSKLIESLLTFARTQRQVPQVVRVNMLQLAEQVVQEQLQALGEAAARVRVHMLEMPREAHGDPVLLKQVYANLISNAFKFTRKQEEPEIEIGGYERDGQLVYFVRDNGAGFPSEKVHDLFRVFRRLHGQAEFEGTGIGLANVRKIVERHGGEVCAEGEDGKGATFYFALPANP